MPKIEICSDYTLICSAYKTKSTSKYQTIVDITDKEWMDLQRVEAEYWLWQEKLIALDKEAAKTGVKNHAKKVTAKAARIKSR